MNILVCISNVPDTTSKINFKDQNEAFDTNGVQFIINPNDEFGLSWSNVFPNFSIFSIIIAFQLTSQLFCL